MLRLGIFSLLAESLLRAGYRDPARKGTELEDSSISLMRETSWSQRLGKIEGFNIGL